VNTAVVHASHDADRKFMRRLLALRNADADARL
jgi:hypothetical protein